MTFNDFLLYMQINVLFSHHRGSFQLQEQTERAKTPQLENVQRMKDLATPSPKWNVSFQPLPSGFREFCRRGSRNFSKISSGWKVLSKQCTLDAKDWFTYELIEMLVAVTKGFQRCSTCEGCSDAKGNEHDFSSLTKKLSTIDNISQRK